MRSSGPQAKEGLRARQFRAGAPIVESFWEVSVLIEEDNLPEAPQQPIARWRGEFIDAAMEGRYRHSVMGRTAAQLRTAAIVSAVLFMLFGLSDYALLGNTTAFQALLALRTVVVLACVLLILAVARNPEVADRLLPVNITIFIALTGIILIVPLRPETISTQIPAVVVAGIAQYLFIPNRIPWSLGQSLYLSLGFLLATVLWAPLPPGELLTLTLLLILVNTIGLMTVLRLAHLQREQFASLLHERESNRRLTAEIDRRQELEEQLLRNARIDELTGLNNRRHFFELAERELHFARMAQVPLSLCILDLDHFKTLNDSFGHAGGDRALAVVADACAGALREKDIIGRLGGEEFVVALPSTDLEEARAVAERLRRHIAGIQLPEPFSDMRLSATIGVTEVEPAREGLDEALQRADDALYAGKRAGRNRVVAVEDDENNGVLGVAPRGV